MTDAGLGSGFLCCRTTNRGLWLEKHLGGGEGGGGGSSHNLIPISLVL